MMRVHPRLLAGLGLIAAAVPASPALARADIAIAGRDAFRVGNAGVVCQATRRSEDAGYASMFDRGYEVVCRDAATPVGTVYALEGAGRTLAPPPGDCRPAADRAPAEPAILAGATTLACTDRASGLTRVVIALSRGRHSYVASGFAAYAEALRIALASLVEDRPVAGSIAVAVTGADDPAALARVQAERFDPAQALAAGMARANDGDHADAIAFFDRLEARARAGERGADRPALYLAGQAIEQSQLGNHANAEALFARAAKAGIGDDAVFGRLYRNLYAMHRLDMGDAAGALARIAAPVPVLGDDAAFSGERLAAGYIDHPLAQRLTIDDLTANRLGNGAQPLTDRERAALLDAQALFISAEAHRLTGNRAAAGRELDAVIARFDAVRGGRVLSMAWLVADVYGAKAQIAEADGRYTEAGRAWGQAVAAIAALAPDSAVWLKTRARATGFAARHGNADAAAADYAELVRLAGTIEGGGDALRGELDSYFATLAAHADQPGAVDRALLAAQAMVRPGVAQTEAVLARELSAGSDEAADLFRQSLALAREVRAIDQTLAEPAPAGSDAAAIATRNQALAARRATLAQDQTAIQVRLSGFSRYRAIGEQSVPLAELATSLKTGEAYYKLLQVGDALYAIWIEPGMARLARLDLSGTALETLVDRTRDSIVSYEGNQIVTNPFDLASARRLHAALFAPFADRLPAAHHLVFEPDGAMLKLPPGVLVGDDRGIAAYTARTAKSDGDAFDFTGIAWLARSHMISTAASPRAFVGLRATAPSAAPHRYLGLGHNAVPPPGIPADSDPCAWPRSTWTHPVSGDELALAAKVLGGAGNTVITGDGFSDTALAARRNLADYKVIQFATHGLVTAPHPACAAEPALVTSFGPAPSQGLLTFRAIFDLRLNADTVILSACDTAGAASVDATRAAGITTGGNFALDGLVRAFVGAGARSVVASHWPVPDDFHATQRLMGGLFGAGLDMPLGEALRRSETQLMDDPLTSHPYYWAAFAIVGDAARPMTRP